VRNDDVLVATGEIVDRSAREVVGGLFTFRMVRTENPICDLGDGYTSIVKLFSATRFAWFRLRVCLKTACFVEGYIGEFNFPLVVDIRLFILRLILRRFMASPVVVVPPLNRRFTAFGLHLPQQALGLLF